MGKEQQSQLDAILRQGGLDTAADVASVRAAFNALMAQVPVPADVQQKPIEIDGVGGIEVTIGGNESERVILYFPVASTSSARRRPPSRWWVTSSGERASMPSDSETTGGHEHEGS